MKRAAAITLLLAIVTARVWYPTPCACKEPAPRDARPDRAARLERLIDAMASRNKAPEIVEVGYLDVPLFGAKYDWADEDRVLRAVERVLESDDDGLVLRLLEHAGDERYSLTWADEIENMYASNVTVGYLCKWIAEERLLHPCRQFVPGVWSLDMPAEFDRDPKRWIRARSGKALYELQIESCQQAIEQVATMTSYRRTHHKADGEEHLSKEQRAQIIARIREQIEKLKRTKKPDMPEIHFPGERWDVFNAEKAKRIRDDYDWESKHPGRKVDRSPLNPYN